MFKIVLVVHYVEQPSRSQNIHPNPDTKAMPALDSIRITCSLADAANKKVDTYTDEDVIVPLGITLLRPLVGVNLTQTTRETGGVYNITLNFYEDCDDATPVTINFEQFLKFCPNLVVDFTDFSINSLDMRVLSMDTVQKLEIMLMQNSQIKIVKNGKDDKGRPEYIILLKSPIIDGREISSYPFEEDEVEALIGK